MSYIYGSGAGRGLRGCSDLDREVSFLGKLGFEEAFTTVADGKMDRAFIKINDKQFIEVYPQTDSTQPLGWVHVCYESDN